MTVPGDRLGAKMGGGSHQRFQNAIGSYADAERDRVAQAGLCRVDEGEPVGPRGVFFRVCYFRSLRVLHSFILGWLGFGAGLGR